MSPELDWVLWGATVVASIVLGYCMRAKVEDRRKAAARDLHDASVQAVVDATLERWRRQGLLSADHPTVNVTYADETVSYEKRRKPEPPPKPPRPIERP